MKIGIISDIHGNLPALEVILDNMKNEKCDRIYCLGDVIGIGPYPKECLELILKYNNIKFLLGNHEVYYVYGTPQDIAVGEQEHQKWVHAQLGDEFIDILKEFSYIIKEEVNGLTVAFMHYALDELGKSFKKIKKDPSIQDLDELFNDVKADIIFFGHEHKPQEARGRRHYVNVGSSGCTKENVTHYTILEVNDTEYSVKKVELQYDKEKVLRELKQRKVPDYEFISRVFFNLNL